MVIIHALVGLSSPKNIKLKAIISRIKQEVKLFDKISYLHIKKDLNKEANSWAKK
jgi:hypothetical protein